MPSIVTGPFKILRVDGTIHFGDIGIRADKSTSKTYSGSGSNVSGDFPVVFNGVTNVNTLDPDVLDSNVRSVG